MKLAISGTYSSGKTRTTMALSHYTGMPRTLARTIREIMPDAVPGKRLADVTPAEFLQIMIRAATRPGGGGSPVQRLHLGRLLAAGMAVRGGSGDARDGTPARQRGWNGVADREPDPEMAFFEQVVAQFGHAFKQHVKNTFDVFVHLQHELPIANDGHRPMNERFRTTIDEMLLATLDELEIPYHIVSGDFASRMETVVGLLGLPTVRSLPEAIALANEEYAQLDLRLENERARVGRA